MAGKIYLGTILGEDNQYYKGIFEDTFIEKYSAKVSNLSSLSRILEISREYIYGYYQGSKEFTMTMVTQENHTSEFKKYKELTINADKSGSVGIDENYIYIPYKDADYSTIKYFRKYKKETLSHLASTRLDDAERITSTLSDGYSLYCLFNTGAVKKFNIDTLELEAEIVEGQDILNSAVTCRISGGYIYIGGRGKSNVGNIQKVDTETLEIVAQSQIQNSNTPSDLIVDEHFIYVYMNKAIQKVDKSTLEIISTIPTLGKIWDIDDRYIYSTYQNSIYKYDKESLEFISKYTRDDNDRGFDALRVDGDVIHTYTSSVGFKTYKHIYKKIGYERVN